MLVGIMSFHSLICFTLAIAFSFSSFSLTQATTSDINGFSVELIHIDSPKSPFYNASQTPFQRVQNALRRSINHVNRFRTDSFNIQPRVISDVGQYLMNIQLGTPPVTVIGIADTGSSLIWTQCAGCTRCFQTKDPLFDPKASSTYYLYPCDSDGCRALQSSCSGDQANSCKYEAGYGDGCISKGDFGVDTLTLPSTTGTPITFPNSAFGCGYDNSGYTGDTAMGATGIIGMGTGMNSLAFQVAYLTGFKFSYCLVIDYEGLSSKLNYGSIATVSGDGVVTTPLVLNDDGFYRVTLEAISIEGNTIPLGNPPAEGNFILDSGSTLAYLPEDIFQQLQPLVAQKLGLEIAPQTGGFLCFKSKTDITNFSLTLQFSGAAVVLGPVNTFFRYAVDVVCLSFVPATIPGIFLLGNTAQVNFLIGYDVDAKTVSFKATDCSKQ